MIRPVKETDLSSIKELSGIPGFFNLINDDKILLSKIENSTQSFNQTHVSEKSKWMFVYEEEKKVVGTSMIAAKHGTKEEPHFYLQVGREERFSKTINTGFIHGTLELHFDTDGPSEIGGIVVSKEFRNHEAKIGRQLSYVRFLYAAIHREFFQSRIIAELLPPLDSEGHSLLWDAVGRRFTNMDYWEADELCRQDKEFIFSLFPSGKFYTTFLSPEARSAIGRVGDATKPAFHLLKKMGFEYMDQVDPFDGGPHLWVETSDCKPIQNTKTGVLKKKKGNTLGLIASIDPFIAYQGYFSVIDNEIHSLDGDFEENQKVAVVPYL